MTETPDRTESLFAAAVALASAAERAAYLDRACAGDAALRGHVEALLRAHERAGHLLDRPAVDLELTGAHTASPEVGTVIAGRYKLLEAIGEGGMGTVWVAEQMQPVRRKVALKLIKAGMDSKSVLARFEAERQALAVMEHPNIAKVLDGGLTETGRPFFVMEYVKGVPITEYCDATRLSVPERLNLFGQVCAAVQHAHQKGIIHRDLKPSNILVAPYDDKPVPKVIDFGLAKAMHQSLTERTLHTAHETVLGTPLYMSPEQAQLNNLDVDTRSDIYALGVLLYELLTGTTPLEKQRFKEAAWDEIKRIIREEEAPRPSMRLSSSQALPSLAASRHTEPARLTKLVRGELDWIVMKALDKDRTRRYSTASEFAADITRHLHDEPVLAGPPRVTYRLRKFLHKHRSAVTAVAMVVMALVVGLGASLTLYFQAEESRQSADEARTAEERKTMELGAALQEKAATVIKEKEARLDADKSRWLAERRLYGAGVLLAKSCFDQLQVGQARRALDGTEPKLRGWEWRYLDCAIDTSRRTLHPSYDVAWNLHFAADGKTLAWATQNDGVCWMDPEKPDQIRKINGRSAYANPAGEPIPNAAFTDDLTFAAAYTPFGLVLWRTSDNEAGHDPSGKAKPLGPVRKPPDGEVGFMGTVTFSADGRRLFAAGEKRLACWDRDSAKELWSFPIEADQTWSLAVIRDEKLAAVGFHDDYTVRVYDLIQKKEVWRTERHWSTPRWAFFTPDGTRLVTHGGAQYPRVYDLETKKQILQGAASYTSTVALSRDGKVGALGTGDGDVVLFDVISGKELRSLRGHNAYINALAFSPDGTLLASGGRDKAIKLWDVKSGRLVQNLVGHTEAVHCLAFAPDGRTLLSGADNYTLKFWDLSDPPPMRQLQFPLSGQVRSWQFLKDSRTMLIGGYWHVGGVEPNRGLVYLCNVETGTIERSIGPHGHHVQAMALSADEHWLVTGAEEGTAKLWDFAAGTEVRSHFEALPKDQRPLLNAVSICPDGSSYAAGLANGDLVVWDRASGAERWRAKRRSPASWPEYFNDRPMQFKALRYTPDGRHLIAVSWYGYRLVTIYAVDTGKIIFESPQLADGAKWSLSVDGRFLAFGSDMAGRLLIYDFHEGKAVRTLEGFGNITALAFAPDGQRLAVAARGNRVSDPSIKIVAWEEGRTLLTVRGHESWVSDLAFLPDGSRLVSGSWDHTVKLWDANSGQELLTLPMGPRPEERVNHVLVSPDGSRIVATDGHPDIGAGQFHTVVVWWAKR